MFENYIKIDPVHTTYSYTEYAVLSDSTKRIIRDALNKELKDLKESENLFKDRTTFYWNKSDKDQPLSTNFEFDMLNYSLNNLRKARAKIKKIEAAIKEIKAL